MNDDFGWQEPVNLGEDVNTSGFDGCPSYFEGSDGGAPQLYFNRNSSPVPGGGELYVSEQAPDGSFGTAVPVAELNSASTDQRPSIAHNGLDIYFFSDRAGSSAFDIWGSTRESPLLDWSPPTNLGIPINTAVGELPPSWSLTVESSCCISRATWGLRQSLISTSLSACARGGRVNNDST